MSPLSTDSFPRGRRRETPDPEVTAGPARQSVDNLHDDITRGVLASERVVVDVIDPSPGVFGGEPLDGLVTIVYRCNCEWSKGCQGECSHAKPEPGYHSHHALYGPVDEDQLVATRPVAHYSLYAD